MDTVRFKSVRIGDVLQEYGYVDDSQITQALAYQKEHKGVRLGGALIELGFITETQMLNALARSLELQRVDIGDVRVDIEAVMRLPRPMAEKNCVLPIKTDAGTMTVVINDPMNFYGLEEVSRTVGMPLEVCLCERLPLEKAIEYYYSEVGAKAAAEEANRTYANEEEELSQLTIEEGEDDEAPIINLLNRLVRRAYSTGTSDIHIEPFEQKTTVRMRVDGTIVEYVTLQKSLHNSLIARIKILSDLDIAERRVPQDGHLRMRIDGNNLNIRVSILPTVFGEKAVLRLLANNTPIDHSGTMGMSGENYEKFKKMLEHPNGIIYITGPTGSGKSTTLYMVLESLSNRNVNISTIEDPVEKNLERINQSQVNVQAGMTFESGLRALLRQDPDIIMVGETRDAETASISVRAAITGHLVFSTLHTNDTASTVIRLADMGLERYMIASSLVGVVAQRLMRKVCPACAEKTEPTEMERALLGPEVKTVCRPRGCHLCNNTGYKGRIAIHEILMIDRTVRRMISEAATVEEIRDYAIREQGMKTLRTVGTELVAQGITTVEELNRIAYDED